MWISIIYIGATRNKTPDLMDCNDVSPATSRKKTYDFGNLLIGK